MAEWEKESKMLAFLGMVVLVVSPKAATRSEEDRSPSLSASMMPKASLNCWMAEWEKESKMLAFLGMVVLVVAPVGPLLDGRVHCGHCGLVLGIVSSLPKKECYLS